MISIITFILVLAVLVLAHEWGHFIAAKKSGLIVEEFGFGFPPRIFGIKKGETVYSINLLPLGGFVKILGEDGEEEGNSRSFASKSAGIRSFITASGVAMNFILAAIILSIGFYIGLPQAVDSENQANAKNIEVQILAINGNSPAEFSGLKLGDAIKSARNGNEKIIIDSVEAFQNFTKKNQGKELTLEIQRGEKPIEIKTIPRINPPEGEGPLGIALAQVGIVSYPWYRSVWLGIKSSFVITWEIIKGFAGLLKNLFLAGRIPQEISGPVGIAVMTGQAAGLGFNYLLQLTALISLNLAVLNFLPFPALDGGRILFFGIEKIKGSRINPRVENAIHSIGLYILLALIILITYRDILRLK